MIHPLFAGFDERHDLREIAQAMGFEHHLVGEDDFDDRLVEQYERDGDAAIERWQPEAPAGFLEVGKWDTEDGPIAMFVKPLTPMAWGLWMVAGNEPAQAVLQERGRQVSDEQWSAEHDDQYRSGELVRAAVCYADYAKDDGSHAAALRYRRAGAAPAGWPWDAQWWKPKDRHRDLVRAGALCLAELDRHGRASGSEVRQDGVPTPPQEPMTGKQVDDLRRLMETRVRLGRAGYSDHQVLRLIAQAERLAEMAGISVTDLDGEVAS